jgi:Sensors of blue-light using FAD
MLRTDKWQGDEYGVNVPPLGSRGGLAVTICRLVYLSSRNFSIPLDLQGILETSRRNNARVGVTGFLLFDGDVFAQALEGTRAAVTHTYNRLSTDPRHTSLHMISFMDVQERLFPNWSMGLMDRISREARQKFLSSFTVERAHPNKISPERLLFFMQTVAADVPEVER